MANKICVVFHQDNARPHTSAATRQNLWDAWLTVSPHIFMWSAAVGVVLAQYHSTILEVLEEQREQFPHHVKAPLRHPEGSTGKHCVSQAWHDFEMTIVR
ncbi:hypothetical protein TNCV_4836881 [Trichonephila clavipes]|nr:hypothetical protein TNCV_4836881 [Trichonephila clavipes]